MQGFVLRTLQVFVQDTYGLDRWDRVAARAELETTEFESMLHYDRSLVDSILLASCLELGKPREAMCEDVGNYLISHPNCQAVRRLLRYGGADFVEFLYSLEDLPERARLTVPDLDLPVLTLIDGGDTEFTLRVEGTMQGFGFLLVGMLRAMADDYGSLALLDHQGRQGECETIHIIVVKDDYSEGNEFDLGGALVENRA